MILYSRIARLPSLKIEIKHLLFVFFLFSLILSVDAQNQQKIDSLFQLLEKSDINNFEKAEAYFELGSQLSEYYPDSAYIFLDKALVIANELDDKYLMAKGHSNQGYRDLLTGKYYVALQKLNLADSLVGFINSENTDNASILRLRQGIYRFKSIAHQYLNNHENSLKYNLQCIAIAEELKDSIGLARQFYNIAYTHFSLENFTRSHKYLEKANDIGKKINYLEVQCSALILKSYIFDREKKYDSIKIFATEAMKIAKQTNNIQNKIEALILIGNAHILEDSIKQANKIFLEVLSDAKALNAPMYQASALGSLGQINKDLENFKESRSYFKEFMKINKTLKNSVQQRTVLHEYSQMEYAAGNYKQAYDLFEEFNTIQDSLFTKENRQITSDLEAKYESAKKDVELSNQQITINKQANQRNLFMGLGLLSLLIAGFFWHRKNTNTKIYNQQKKIDTQNISQLEKEKKIMTMNALIEGQEAERIRIAKDLHDGLGGLLATVKTRMSNISEEIKKLESFNIYEKTTQMVDDACDEVRRISHNLLPGALRLDGLKTAVEQLGDDLQETHSFNVNVEVIGFESKLDETKEVFLYRMIQEATNNIIKHANAKNVLIQLSETNTEYHLTIEDDGDGFTYDPSSRGLGLKSIQSRVDHLEGTMDISSSLTEGTTIIMHLPKSAIE